MSRNFLTTYRPLCGTAFGRRSIALHALPPFVDGSCRREPDLQHEWPSISALCRAGSFAPRLREGDKVAYMTKKGFYGQRTPHWRLTALLQVIHRFESHQEAAHWYLEKSTGLPRNCMVPRNPPLPLDHTDFELDRNLKSRMKALSPAAAIRLWDAAYRQRAELYPVLLACKPLFVEVWEPPAIQEQDWQRWYGSQPGTRNPPVIQDAVWNKLVEQSRRRINGG